MSKEIEISSNSLESNYKEEKQVDHATVLNKVKAGIKPGQASIVSPV